MNYNCDNVIKLIYASVQAVTFNLHQLSY